MFLYKLQTHTLELIYNRFFFMDYSASWTIISLYMEVQLPPVQLPPPPAPWEGRGVLPRICGVWGRRQLRGGARADFWYRLFFILGQYISTPLILISQNACLISWTVNGSDYFLGNIFESIKILLTLNSHHLEKMIWLCIIWLYFKIVFFLNRRFYLFEGEHFWWISF